MRMVVTGGTGLIGSRFISLLENEFEIESLSGSDGVDITDKNATFNFLEDNKPDIILHLAAKTDVDDCEEDKENDVSKLNSNNISFDTLNIDDGSLDSRIWMGDKSAFTVNVVGTKNIVDYARKNNTKVVYISTDFVFPGDGEYDEESGPSPINWYGQTKYFGELIVENLDAENYIIVRTSFPYGYKTNIKKDLVWGLVEYLVSSDSANLISDQIITPTFIDDIVEGISFLINNKHMGIYNISGSSFITPMEIGLMIKKKMDLSVNLRSIKVEGFYEKRAKRPFQSKMKNARLVRLGFKPKTFEEGFNLVI